MEINDILKVKNILRDLPSYARHNLKIKSKDGIITPFIFNKAQTILHKKIEEQKAATGKVRCVIIKGRQQGVSTYTAARFYHRAATNYGINTFIFAHDSNGSDSLYKMVKNFYDNSLEILKPKLGATNAKEYIFADLKSGYRVGTAGNQSQGRSMTIQQLHWSEVAYSPNCDDHVTGLLQCVPSSDGTEIILESTSKGAGDFFHKKVMQGLEVDSDYKTIFLPWYWQDEYTIKGNFTPNNDELKIYDAHKDDGLTYEHLAWRRLKLKEFDGDDYRFKREYPLTVEEAFESSDDDAVINARSIRRAITKDINVVKEYIKYPLVIGLDPARLGDKTAYVMRHGRAVLKMGYLPPSELVATTARIADMINRFDPLKMFIDAGSFGINIIDSLKSMGYRDVVVGVNFGGKATQQNKYYNKRAEMYMEAARWLNDDVSVHIFSADEKLNECLISEGASVRYAKDDYNRLIKLEPKDDIKKRLGRSPDLFDAFVLTFAQPVRVQSYDDHTIDYRINTLTDDRIISGGRDIHTGY